MFKFTNTFAAAACILSCGCGPAGLTPLRWESTDGPYAQNIAAVLPAMKSPGVLLVALTNGEIDKSTNDGKTWNLFSNISGFDVFLTLTQDPERPARMYATTDSGAFRSTDGGKTWSPLRIAARGKGVRVIAVDPWSPNIMFAGTEGNGICRSVDGGESWSESNDSSDQRYANAEVYALVVDPAKPNSIYGSCTGLGVVRSTDGGTTWGSLTDNPSAMGGRATHLLLRKGGNGMMMYGTNLGNIMTSTNSGDSWNPSRNGAQSDRIVSLLADPRNPDRVIAGTEFGIFVTTDFGRTWNPGGGNLPKVPTAIVLSETGEETYAYGSGIGLRASTDNCRSWHAADAELGGATVRALTSNAAGDHIFAAAGSTCLSTTIPSEGVWHPAGNGLTGGEVRTLITDPDLPAVLYATTPADIYASSDAGNSWVSIARSLRMSPVLFEPHPTIKTRVFATSDQAIFVSTDRGTSWVQSKPLASRWNVKSMSFSPTNAGVIVAATAANGVLVSSDGGFTWEASHYGLPSDPLALVTFDDKDPDVLYAFTGKGGSFRSTNKGVEWNVYAPPWTVADRTIFAGDREQPSSVVALVNNKSLYFSPSGGGTWFSLSEQQIPAQVIKLQWNAVTGIIVAGTLEKGVYWISIGSKIKDLLGE